MEKTRFRDETGSVQLYVIILIVPLFLFHAILIDLVRVKIAELKTEQVVKAASRSILAGYEPKLRTYGLFGSIETNSEMLSVLHNVLSKSTSNQDGMFQFTTLQFSADDSKVRPLYSLANTWIFTRQVEMDMRYRAPIDYTLEIYDKWKNREIFGAFKGAATFQQIAEQLEQLWNLREKAMDESWETAQRYIFSARIAHHQLLQNFTMLGQLASEIGIVDLVDLKYSINIIEKQIEDGEQTLTSLNEDIKKLEIIKSVTDAKNLKNISDEFQLQVEQTKSSIASLIQKKNEINSLIEKTISYIRLVDSSKLLVQSLYEQQNGLLTELMEKLSEARNINKELSNMIQSKIAEQEKIIASANTSMNQIPIYSMADFSTYETEAANVSALLNGVRLQWNDLLWFAGERYDLLSQGLNVFSEQMNHFERDRREKELVRSQQNLIRAQQTKNLEEQTNQTIRLLQSQISGCINNIHSDAEKEIYNQLDVSVSRYSFESEHLKSQYNIERLDQVSQIGSKALNLWSKLVERLTDIRSELFFDEYTLTYFGYRTNPSNGQGAGSPIEGQEVEYALYGLNSCISNYLAAASEMFLLLLAIRSTEAILSPQEEWISVGSPMLMFISIVARASSEAAIDLNKILKGESIPIFKKFTSLSIKYSDLLRLFLILHTNDGRLKNRLQSLIELRTGINLSRASTYVQTTINSSIDLWFPKFIQLNLYRLGISDCESTIRRCIITRTAVASYD